MTQLITRSPDAVLTTMLMFTNSHAVTDMKLPTIQQELPALIQIDSPEERHWQSYLNTLQQAHAVSGKTIQAALDFRRMMNGLIQIKLRRRPPTQAGPTSDGNLQVVWDNGEHHFEVDCREDGQFDWFYRNRKTKEYDGDEDCQIKHIPENAVRYFERVLG